MFSKLFPYLWICILVSMFSCQNSKKKEILRLLSEWDGKEVIFPSNSVFSIQGKDTVDYHFEEAEHKVVCYVDSVGCFSCKLQLERWQAWMQEVDSISNGKVSFIFYFQTKNLREMQSLTRRHDFKHPVCFDEKGELNALNHFPTDVTFQTFLLNRENRVVAIGNPILNPKIKELYLRIIQGKREETNQEVALTEVGIDKTTHSLGEFDRKQEQQCCFVLTNKGKHPLLVTDVVTSCSCTTVAFPKEAIAPGKTATLTVTYRAEKPEVFLREISVYCNAAASPLQLEITGEAKEITELYNK